MLLGSKAADVGPDEWERLGDYLWREHQDTANIIPSQGLLPTTCSWQEIVFSLNSPEELSSNTVEYTKESFLSGVTQDMLSCWTKTERYDELKHFRSTSFLSHSNLWNPGIENEAISLNKIQELCQSSCKNGIRRRLFQRRTQLR